GGGGGAPGGSARARQRRPDGGGNRDLDHGRDHGRPAGTRGRAADDRQGPNPRRGPRSRGDAGSLMDAFALFTPLVGHVAGVPVEETLPGVLALGVVGAHVAREWLRPPLP